MKHFLLLALPFFAILISCNQSIKYSVAPSNSAQNSGKNASVNSNSGIQQINGKCFQKCVVPDRYESAWIAYPVYTGNDGDAPIRTETLLITPPQTKWLKKDSGEICLEQTPAVTKEIQVLADTLFHRDFKMTKFEYKRLAEKGGSLRETEVLCSEARTPNLFLQISTALKAYGYLPAPTAQWDVKLSQAVQKFQKDSCLPVGDLNLETLEKLGI